jgi:hypothetical protein
MRAFCTALVIIVQTVGHYGSTRATLPMLLPVADGGLSPQGTFWLFFGSHWSKWLVCVVCYTGDDGQNVGGHERTVQSSLVQDWEIRQSGDIGGRDASPGDKSGNENQ